MDKLFDPLVITAVFSFLTAVLGYLNRRTIQEVHYTMNSRLDSLLIATQAVAHAAGMKDQRDQDNAALAASKSVHPSDAPGSP